MDPITIGAFLASAGSSLLGGLLSSDASKAKVQAARQAYSVQKAASATQDAALEAQAAANRDAADLEWKSGELDLKTSSIEANAAATQGASDYFNVLIDSANQAFAYNADADTNEFNARISNQMARNSLSVAKAQAHDYRVQGEAAVESRAAVQAGSGFMLQGSPMMVQDVLMGDVELGATRLEHAGDVEATRYEQQGQLQLFNAKISRANANMAKAVGDINAGYVKEATKIKMDAAFLDGDKALLNMQGTLLTARNEQLQTDYLKIANNLNLKATKIQTNANIAAAKTESTASIVSGVGNAFSTIASSGMFG